jgi:hypothetical protein
VETGQRFDIGFHAHSPQIRWRENVVVCGKFRAEFIARERCWQ